MRPLPQTMVAIITPMATDGTIRSSDHTTNVATLAAQGCEGFLVAGSTGEGPYLDAGERGTLVAATREALPTATVVCGINAESVSQALTQIGEAHSAGADAALVATPGTLVRGNDTGVALFFRLVADRSPLPILLYTVPKVTGYILPTDTVADLADHPHIVGMKDSGGDPSRLASLASTMNEGFVVFAGASRALLESHREGAYGAITASANYAFKTVQAATGGDTAAQQALIDVTGSVEGNGVPGTKRAAEAAGLIAGPPRLPLLPVADDVGIRIDSAVKSAQQR